MSKARASIKAKGRVQGVFFRQATREEAISLHLTGWVRNLPSGDAEAVFEGDKQAIHNMVAWCKKGPSKARVDELIVKYDDPTGEFSTFKIR